MSIILLLFLSFLSLAVSSSLPTSFLQISISVSQSHFSPHSAVVALLSGLWVLERRRLPWSQNVAYKHPV